MDGDHGGHGGDGLGHSVAHSHSHHGGGDSHGGHATHEALFVAYSHGGGHSGVHSFGHHASNAHPHNMQVVHLGMGRQDTKGASDSDCDQEHPGEIRTFVVHVAHHGQPAILSELKRITQRHDLLRIDLFRPNFDPVDVLKYELADWSAFSEPYQHVNMPEGFYPGATGRTRIIRQYWQVGKRPRLFALKTPPVFDKDASTFIELSVIEWRYDFTGDYETKLILTIGSLPVWDEVAGAWGYKRTPFERHQRAALKICNHIFNYLSGLAPTRASQYLRAHINAKYPPQHDDQHPDGVEVGTPEDDADLSRGRHDDPEKPPPPASTPTDDGGGDDSDGGGEEVASLAPETAGLVASGANIDAVIGRSDAVPVSKKRAPVDDKSTLVIELDD
jgi:hypothetical protein